MDRILFDSHAHINNEGYSRIERMELIEKLESSSLRYVMDVGFDLESSKLAIKDAQSCNWCYAVIGVHPHDASTLTDETICELKKMASNPKVKAIGETGLDYYRNLSPQNVQREAFRKQIRLAKELKMPLVIHDRDSGGECIEIIKDEGMFSDERKSLFPSNPVTKVADARVLLHCFSGSAEQALEYVKMGATISIAGPVTYKNNKKTVAVAEKTPIEHLLIETDSPYLTPEPKRGKPNDSTNVEYVARKIAEIKGMSFEDVAKITAENAKRFYNI